MPSLPSCTCPFFDSLVEVMSPPFAATPCRKRWYDKRANKLLGDDEQYNVSPSSRYALICEKCIAHNGLVKACGRMRIHSPFRPHEGLKKFAHFSKNKHRITTVLSNTLTIHLRSYGRRPPGFIDLLSAPIATHFHHLLYQATYSPSASPLSRLYTTGPPFRALVSYCGLFGSPRCDE